MDTLVTVGELKARLAPIRKAGLRIALVPTMGALHAGHLSLVRLARSHAEIVVASVFVNPRQFGAGEDLDSYPRDLDADAQALQDAGCSLLFAPTEAQMYPPGFETSVTLSRTTKGLCGDHRPGHFDGVTTVVLKLLLAALPHVAVFGEKDFQQLTVIRRMVDDLCLDVEIVGGPLVRDDDGMALSSRNAYLSAAEREQARSLSAGLRSARGLYESGERQADILLATVRSTMHAAGVEPEYLELRGRDDLAVLESAETPAVILVAARVGDTRLLDNCLLFRSL